MKQLCIFVLIALVPSLGLAFPGEVIQVKDGDTVVVVRGTEAITCRLYGIDAPETAKGRKPGQPWGREAAGMLKSLVENCVVGVELMGSQTYGREVVRLWIKDRDLNLEMVRRGMAWAYVQYLRRAHASEYLEAEEKARKGRVGLWVQVNPLPPWEFRRGLQGRHRLFRKVMFGRLEQSVSPK
jgi:endonuclease YncB( thermonuclease family)